METAIPPQNSLPVLLVDDEVHALQSYEMQLLGDGISNIISCQSAREALALLSHQKVSIILLDLRMPEISGEEVLSIVSKKYPQVPIIIITAIDDVDTAVRCMRAGAYDYIIKPVDQTRLATTVKRALEFRDLRLENDLLKQSVLYKKLNYPEAFADIITNNEKMHAIFQYIESIARTSQPVLITGETGSGKELIAQAIHKLCGRTGQLVTVNVAGLDDNMFADTLFGHKKGAFTGADQVRAGLIEKAENGTLFLDEIGDLTMSSQVKLLRLLQEREYYQLGSDSVKSSNTRIIVATNRDLKSLQDSGTFRADLYYRLLSHHIELPPLRERRDDIPLLVEFFLKEAAHELNKSTLKPPQELYMLLSSYHFPGNIRELKALIFDAASRYKSGKWSMDSFIQLYQPMTTVTESPAQKSPSSVESIYASLDHLPSLEQSEELLIKEVLKRTNGNQTLAATMLGITRQTLYRKLNLKSNKT